MYVQILIWVLSFKTFVMEKCKDTQKSMSKMNLCGPVTRLQQASALGQYCFICTPTQPLSIHYFEANTAHYLILLKNTLLCIQIYSWKTWQMLPHSSDQVNSITNKVCWHPTPPIWCTQKSTKLCCDLLPPRMHHLNLIMRKHQTNWNGETCTKLSRSWKIKMKEFSNVAGNTDECSVGCWTGLWNRNSRRKENQWNSGKA